MPLQVQKHPLFENVSVAELQQQLDFAIEIRDRTSDANEAVVQIRDVKAQIKERVEQSKNPRLKEIGDLVTQKLTRHRGGGLPGPQPQRPGPAELPDQGEQPPGGAAPQRGDW